MSRTKRLSSALLYSAGLILAMAGSVSAQAPVQAPLTVFEGARLITGDGSAPIENSAFVVENSRFTAGRPARRGAGPRRRGARRHFRQDRDADAGRPARPFRVPEHPGGNHVEGNLHPRESHRSLQRLAFYGVGAAVGVGDLVDRSDMQGGRTGWGDVPLRVRDEVVPNAALFRTSGTGMAWPGSGAQGDPSRVDVSYPVATPEEARAAVDDYVKIKPTFIKIWVDDRRGTKKTLTPELYRAIVDEAHKFNVPVAVHNVTLADAKELMRAGVEGWLHVPVREGDVVDDEIIAIVKDRIARNDRPNMWMTPSLITSWMNTAGGTRPAWLDDPLLRATYSPEQIEQVLGRSAQEDDARSGGARAKEFRGGRPQCDEAAGRRHARGRGHRHRAEPVPDRLFQPPRSRKHGGDRHDADGGDRRGDPRRRRDRAISTPAWWRPARAPTSSCSTPIRWRTSPTRGGSPRSICADRKSPAPRWRRSGRAQFRQSASTR